MRHYPVFIDLRGRRVVVAGAGEVAVAKLRLLMKTEARDRRLWRRSGGPKCGPGRPRAGIELVERPLAPGDAARRRARLRRRRAMPKRTRRAAAIGRAAGALVNIVDDLDGSDFITPAIVDRDPVTVAIGTEGAAPVLARKIKAEVEAMLPATLGRLARIGQAFRARVEALDSRARRAFWTRFYFERGPLALQAGEDAAARGTRRACSPRATRRSPGVVHLVGTGPGDPELLTLKARRLLHEADVVIHDRLVPQAILELARREATIVEVGKTAFGPSWKQDDIGALIVSQALRRQHAWCGSRAATRRSSGGSTRRSRRWRRRASRYGIVPGITSASAGAGGDRAVADQARAQLGRSAS